MKKFLIIIIGILLLVFVSVSAFHGVKIGKMYVYSIKNVQEKSAELDNKITEVNTLINQNYKKSIDDLEKASTNLRKVKSDYESKLGIGISEIDKYKIEYLWWLIGDYAANEGLRLYLDVQETTLDNTYNIVFTLYGSYVDITDFLYDIEKDDNLDYRPQNFKIEASLVSDLPADLAEKVNADARARGEKPPTVSTDILSATFMVENVIINFN